VHAFQEVSEEVSGVMQIIEQQKQFADAVSVQVSEAIRLLEEWNQYHANHVQEAGQVS